MTRLVLIFALALAGCGSRTGLSSGSETDEAGPDAGPTSRDAGRTDAGGGDAGPPAFECPTPTRLGYTVSPIGPVDFMRPVANVTLAGDGTQTWIAWESDGDPGRIFVYRLESPTDVSMIHATRGSSPRLGAADGEVALAYLTPGGDVGLDVLGAGAPREVVLEARRGPATELSRPVFNGREWVLGFSNGFEVFFGSAEALRISGWLAFGPGGPVVRAAVDPATGEAWAVLRTGDGRLRLYGFDRDGGAIGPREGARLDRQGWQGVPSLAFDDSGLDMPIVLGGFTDDAMGPRFRLRRFRRDGSEAAGYSSPAGPGPYRHDLASGAPPGYASGYGLVGASGAGGGFSQSFHGATDGFVGGSEGVGGRGELDGYSVAIARHPCGFLIAWTESRDSSEVELLVAVPRAP